MNFKHLQNALVGPFTAVTRVQIPSGTPRKQRHLQQTSSRAIFAGDAWGTNGGLIPLITRLWGTILTASSTCKEGSMKDYSRNSLFESAVCTAVFAVLFGLIVACGGGRSLTPTPRVPNATSVPARMLTSGKNRTAIFPTNTGNQPVLAGLWSFFGNTFSAQATITTLSQLAQSYESSCVNFTNINGGTGSGAHSNFGNTGFVVLPIVATQAQCITAVTAIGANGQGSTGFPTVFNGTVNNLVVYGRFVSGVQFRCLDTTSVPPITDGQFVLPYYNLANDSVVLGSGTTQLAIGCSITVPAGDDVQSITVQWLKS